MDEIKKIVQYRIQKIFGVKRYLFCFGVYRALLKLFVRDEQLSLFVKLSQVKKGDIIDIGANVGTHSIYYGKKMPDKQIVGFEPLGILANTSKQVIRFFKLKNCIIMQEGIGERNEQVTLHTPYEQGVFMHGLTHIKEVGAAIDEPTTVTHDELVFIRTLDDYYASSGYREIAAIKIDVENHELFVIKGAFDVLTKERPFVFMELWANERKKQTEILMQELGYTQMVIEHEALVLAGNKQVNDYFFIPNECVEFVNL